MTDIVKVTEPAAPPATLPDGSPDDDAQNNLVIRGRDGDPLPDPKAVTMRERESYERVVEGLKIAADAAKHCARREPQRFAMWMGISTRLDNVRRAAVEKAGLSAVIVQRETGDVHGAAMDWTDARKRFRDGLKQAAGGCRQIAVVHRAEPLWLLVARQIEDLEQKTVRAPLLHPGPLQALGGPTNGVLH